MSKAGNKGSSEIIVVNNRSLTVKNDNLVRRGLDSLALEPQRAAIRVLLVDDHQETRNNIRKLLEFEPDIEVVGEASSGEQGLNKYEELLPDIVCTNINMPDMDGVTMTWEICHKFKDVKIFILSVQNEKDYVVRALKAGARGYISKPPKGDEIISIIRLILAHTDPHHYFISMDGYIKTLHVLAGDFLPYERIGKFSSAHERSDGPVIQIQWNRADFPLVLEFTSVRRLEKVSNDILGLNLKGTKLTDSGLSYLCGLQFPKLQSLNIAETLVSDEGLQELGRLTMLEKLNLSSCKITGKGFSDIKGIINLDYLDLSNTLISDDELLHIRKFQNLRNLRLSRTQIRGNGLFYLHELPNLSWLDLRRIQIDDKGLAHLEEMVSLDSIWISRIKISSDGISRLREALQKCRINTFL